MNNIFRKKKLINNIINFKCTCIWILICFTEKTFVPICRNVVLISSKNEKKKP